MQLLEKVPCSHCWSSSCLRASLLTPCSHQPWPFLLDRSAITISSLPFSYLFLPCLRIRCMEKCLRSR